MTPGCFPFVSIMSKGFAAVQRRRRRRDFPSQKLRETPRVAAASPAANGYTKCVSDRVAFVLLFGAILLLGPLHLALIVHAADGRFALHLFAILAALALFVVVLGVEASTRWDCKPIKIFLLLVIGPALVSWMVPHTQTGRRILSTGSDQVLSEDPPLYRQPQPGDFSIPRY